MDESICVNVVFFRVTFWVFSLVDDDEGERWRRQRKGELREGEKVCNSSGNFSVCLRILQGELLDEMAGMGIFLHANG